MHVWLVKDLTWLPHAQIDVFLYVAVLINILLFASHVYYLFM